MDDQKKLKLDKVQLISSINLYYKISDYLKIFAVKIISYHDYIFYIELIIIHL